MCDRFNEVAVCASWSDGSSHVGQLSLVLLRRVQRVRAEMRLRIYPEQYEIPPEQWTSRASHRVCEEPQEESYGGWQRCPAGVAGI